MHQMMNTDYPATFDKFHQPLQGRYSDCDRYDADYSHYDNHADPELPYPLRHPSDSWLAMHKEIIYDTTENWKRSEFRLRLGTIAINYNLGDDISKTTFGIKVAFKDKYGYPQIWRDLPFIQPDLTPYIQQIAEAISATLSASFVTHEQLSAVATELDSKISAAESDIQRLSSIVVPAVVSAETSAAIALSAAETAIVSTEVAVSAAATAKSLAEIAILSAETLSCIACEAKDEAVAAKDAAAFAETSAIIALSAASAAEVSAVVAVENAAKAKEYAESVEGIASEASAAAATAEAVSFVAAYTAGNALSTAEQAIVSAEHLPIVTDRLVQGEHPTYFDCGTAIMMN